VRLGGRILLELVVGSLLAAGVTVAAWWAGGVVWSPDRPVHASELAAPPAPPAPEGVGLVPLGRPVLPSTRAESGYFKGVLDEHLLAPLRDSRLTAARFNAGGSSISMRVDFESGGRAAFKPDQTNFQTIPRKEVAAFRIDRLLGLGSVPPAIAREFSKEELIAAIDPERRAGVARFEAEVIADELGMVAGELSWWIPKIVDARIEGHLIDGPEGIAVWRRYLAAGAPVPPEQEELVAQISSMIAFDFLINNPDRWSGSNVKGSPDGRQIYFMDNTLSFGPEPDGHTRVRTMLERVEKFSRALVQAVRALDEDDVLEAMLVDTGPYDELLTDREIAGFHARRLAFLAHVDAQIAAHGERAVLVFP
jgi:hypothetical protein